MKKNKWLRTVLVLAGITVAIVIIVLLSGGADNFKKKYEGADLSTDVIGIGRSDTYARYLADHKDDGTPNVDVPVDILSYISAEGLETRTQDDGSLVVYCGDDSTILWTVNVPQAGLYNVELEYLTVESRGVDIERILSINGSAPFSGAETLLFSRIWTDAGEVRKDNQGNDIRPSQKEVFDWQKAYCRDSMGYTVEPFRFYFNQGENTLSLTAVNEPMILRGVTLKAIKSTKTYDEYLQSQPQSAKASVGYLAEIQGENADIRSSPSLYARYDRSSSATVPSSVAQSVLNYIGGDPWNTPGQWIEWNIEVPEDGYYNLTVKARQHYQRGGLSCRSLYIDGEIPFAEMQTITFFYQNEWNNMTLSNADGTPYLFYLTKGSHTVRLEATLGEMGDILRDMENSIFRLNQIYRKLLVLTGVNPDAFRDYNIAGVYPDVIEAMSLESKRLYNLVDRTVACTGQKSDRIAVAQTLAVQLETFVDNNDRITRSFVNFKDNITALGTAMQNLSQTKLDVDYIAVSSPDTSPPRQSENFFDRAWHEISACASSYFVDYNMLGDVYDQDDEVLDVWIMTGRDQSTILKTMIDDTFTPQTGVKVNVKLVDPSALLGATVAGNSPDVVVSTDTWNPVNYALRNAAENLRQFEGFDEVIADFYPSAYAGMVFEDGVYALPETQTFSVMFYRKDILDEIGVPVPETWDELLAIMPTIQSNNLSVGIPYPDVGKPDLSAYYSMIYQNGGAIYSADATRAAIDSQAGVRAFELYTSLYNDYGLPTVFDFISRFRSGEMPIGVFDYSTYNTLMVSAPEIRGLWDFTLIPGTVRTDGNGKAVIDHSAHSQGACCMMIATDDERVKNMGWTFMKWWVSAESQVRFGREIESVLGASARYATANTQAFKQLAWSSKQIDILTEQRRWAVGYREIAGGYYTNWHMINAVRKVTNEKTDARETLLDYARTVNEEITKKRTEFDLPLQVEEAIP